LLFIKLIHYLYLFKKSGMKSKTRFLLLTIFLLISVSLFCQQPAEKLDRVYGLDPTLYNGKKYSYFLPPGTDGHQYLQSPDYFVGGVTIKEEYFGDITLNYDIYNQQLLLRYANENGAFNIIEVSKAWLKGFSLDNMHFEYLDLGDGLKFYQVLGDGKIKILFHWKKDLKLDVGATSTNFAFTKAFRSDYILLEGKLFPYRNKRSLIKVFGPEKKQDIKSYLRKNRIRLKKASDQDMTGLINYIDTL